MEAAFDDAVFKRMEKAYLPGGAEGARLAAKLQELPDEASRRAAEAAALFLDALFTKRNSAAVDAFLKAYEFQKALPEPMLGYALYTAIKCERRAELAWPLLHCAAQAAENGKGALAMELIKKIYNDAYSGFDAEFLLKGERFQEVSALLERIASPFLRPAPAERSGNAKPRVALITINMLENVSAYAKTASQFAKYLDRSRFDCFEYFTEETLGERKQQALFKSSQRHSELNAPKALAEIRATGATVKFIPKELDYLEGARWLAEELERDGIDAALFQGGIASPMMWVASRLARIPSKCTLCVGINMYQAGQRATFYMSNPVNLEKEKAFWRPEWGRQLFLPGGVDLEAAQATRSLCRAEHKIPPDAVTFGLLSNYPERRATPLYMDCVAKVLKEAPASLFVCMGPEEMKAQKAFMEEKGLAGRCRWLCWQHKDSFASLKLLDFYFNEFPLGGAQAVLEAMACGVPSLAVRWSANYAESAGAEIAGPDCSFNADELDAYVTKAIALASNASLRGEIAESQRKRVEKLYSAKDFINRLAEMALLKSLSSHKC